MGAATWPPTPPLSTRTAKATSPRKPMNQAWVAGGLPGPNSAVPVLPNTGGPATLAAVPVPDVTTARMSWCRESSTGPLTATGAAAAACPGSATSVGGCHVPLPAAAATRAMVRGLANARPWPIDAAATSAVSAGTGNWPDDAARGSVHLVPNPKARAASARTWGVRRPDRPTKAVLHERAKSVRNGTAPGDSPSKLVKGLPPTTARGGHATTSLTFSPRSNSAAAVTTLNDEPGG